MYIMAGSLKCEMLTSTCVVYYIALNFRRVELSWLATFEVFTEITFTGLLFTYITLHQFFMACKFCVPTLILENVKVKLLKNVVLYGMPNIVVNRMCTILSQNGYMFM